MTDIDARMLGRELKKGSAELILLALVESRAHHGYEISKRGARIGYGGGTKGVRPEIGQLTHT